MGRLEKQLDPRSGPVARLAVDLRELRRSAGSPTYREMSRTAGYSPSALSAAAGGGALPSAGVLTAYVLACGGDAEEWQRRRADVARTMNGTSPSPAPPAPAPAPEHPAEPKRDRRTGDHRFVHRAAGLAAAAVLGSLATVVPMAIWGAPPCLSQDHGRPVPAATCPQYSAR